jgi:hypothetical protein
VNAGHLPVTSVRVYVEELDLIGHPGSNVRVDVLSDDGTVAEVRTKDCGVHVRQGEIHDVRSAALNGGRQ